MKKLPLLLISCLVSGCMVGPDYSTPCVEMPLEYSEDQEELPICCEDEDLTEWWTTFNDPFLDDLLDEAIQENFDYRIALEQICIARAQYWTTFTQILPEFDVDAQTSHYRTSQSFAASSSQIGISPIQNFFQVGFDAIWEIDVFGGLRRAAEAALDTWEAAEETARAVKITVLSEVANTYVLINTYQLKCSLVADIVQADEELLELSLCRFQAGLANQQEIETFKAALEADRATLWTYETILKQSIYGLAVLVGRMPECLILEFQYPRPIPVASERIPFGLPGELLRRRPDIRSAERQLAAATEQIGVAVAALYPTFNLTGSSSSFAANPLQGANVGYSSDNLRSLFNAASTIWGVGTLVTWPILDFGKRQAAICAQKHVQEQAYLTYKKTIITALQEVEQALSAYYNEEKRFENLAKEAEANREVWELTSVGYHAGLSDYTQMLQAKEAWLNAVNAATDSQQALTTDLIAVYKAMGGDW